MVGALRRLGFDRVYDTVFGADLTVIEEGNEFLRRLTEGGPLPLFTSCCPGWVKFCEERYPEFVPNLSTCRSPQQMLGAVIRARYDRQAETAGKQAVVVSIMPCTAKKAEILRPESATGGRQDIDYSLTTAELLEMIEEAGIRVSDCPESEADEPFRAGSGAGTLFGATGGVTEAVLRYLAPKLGFSGYTWTETCGVRGFDGIKRIDLEAGGRTIRIAVVSGLANAAALLDNLRSGAEQYELVEVMACPGGCLMGGGQPTDVYTNLRSRGQRSQGLYQTDQGCAIRASQENGPVQRVWSELIEGREHELLHRNFG